MGKHRKYFFLHNNREYVAVKIATYDRFRLIAGYTKFAKADIGATLTGYKSENGTGVGADLGAAGYSQYKKGKKEDKAAKKREAEGEVGVLDLTSWYALSDWDTIKSVKVSEIDESKLPSVSSWTLTETEALDDIYSNDWKIHTEGKLPLPQGLVNGGPVSGEFLFVTMPSGTIRVGPKSHGHMALSGYASSSGTPARWPSRPASSSTTTTFRGRINARPN